MILGVYPLNQEHVSGHNDDENYDNKDDNNDDTQGSSTVPYPRAIKNSCDFQFGSIWTLSIIVNIGLSQLSSDCLNGQA